ncbi:unnamed protein product [Linum trigynum]|uniref:Uncharacterized protein n=1 Tax=Linum trigynum TaxID=586398 RepID=A0AAV2CFS7_9ROSI
MAFQKFTLGLRWNGYTEETGKGATYVGGNFQKIKVATRPLLEDLHQMCTNVTCMDGTRRVDCMVYRYPNRESGSLWIAPLACDLGFLGADCSAGVRSRILGMDRSAGMR